MKVVIRWEGEIHYRRSGGRKRKVGKRWKFYVTAWQILATVFVLADFGEALGKKRVTRNCIYLYPFPWWTGARAWLTSGKVGWSLSAPLICLWRVPICPYRKCAKDGGAESEVIQRGSPPRRHAVRSDQIAGARRRRRNRERFLSMSWEMGSCSDRNVMTASARFDL